MNWLNIELSTLRSESYLGSDPVQRATWLNLMAYCADQENGGKICGCGEWGSRRWLQLLGITKEEVRAESCLWTWVGEDVAVWNYPKAKEAEVRAKREAGKKGGRPLKIKDEKPDGYDVLKPSGLTQLPTEQKRKGKEGKGKEEEGNGKNGDEASPASLSELSNEELLKYFKQIVDEKQIDIQKHKAVAYCEKYLISRNDSDWIKINGKPVKNWKNDFRTWVNGSISKDELRIKGTQQ